MKTDVRKHLSFVLTFLILFLLSEKGITQNNLKGLSWNVNESLKLYCEKVEINAEICPKINVILDDFYSDQLESAKAGIDSLLLTNDAIEGEIAFYLKLLHTRILFKKGLVDKSITQYEELLAIAEESLSLKWYSERLKARLVNLYLEKEEFRKSIVLARKFLSDIDISYHPKFQSGVFQNLGVAYLHLKKFDSASYFLNQSIAVKEQAKDTLGLAISYMDVANVYYNQYLDDQAIPLFLKGLELAKLAGDPKVLRNANLNMAVVEENRGDLKAALTYRKAYEKIQKELWDRDKVWELAEQEKEFEVSLREKEIALQHAEIRTKSWQRNTALLFGVIAIVVLILTVWAYRRIKYSNRIIADQNQELSQLNATKNRLFSIISHDLKSPVLALQNSQQKLAAGIENQPKEQIKEVLEANAQSAAATYKLLNNLLHWSLEQSDQLSFSPELIRLSRLVDQVLYDYQAPVHEKQILLINDVCSTSISVHVDLNLMKIVLRNVLDNAIKFTPEKGSIRISATEDQLVMLSITDSGLGITSDKLQILQSSINGKRNLQSESGTGLGLVLSQSLLKKHGGHLTVTSSQESGTQVQVYLPTSI